VADMQRRYHGAPSSLPRSGPRSLRAMSTRKTTDLAASTLDMATALKASQALSEEAILSKLVDKLLRIVVENTGAQTGVLLTNEDGALSVQAIGRLEDGELTVTGLTGEDVPVVMSIAQYVVHTWESVVLEDASSEEM